MYSFEKVIKPIFMQILLLERQMETLTTLRDTILPKLLSGEILAGSVPKSIMETTR